MMGKRCVIFKSHVFGRASERFAISLGVCAHHCARARVFVCESESERGRDGEGESGGEGRGSSVAPSRTQFVALTDTDGRRTGRRANLTETAPRFQTSRGKKKKRKKRTTDRKKERISLERHRRVTVTARVVL